MPEPLTRLEMDSANCGICGGTKCGHDAKLFLHAMCHMKAGTVAIYDKRDGVLTVRCKVCDRMVGRLLIAKDHEP